MMKKWLCALCALMLCWAVLPAAAETAETENPVTAEELAALGEQIKALALQAAPLNDPASEEAESEDGTAFVYPFGTVYADRTEMTEETLLHAAVITEEEIPAVRGAAADTRVNDLLRAVPCDNADMYGSPTGAVLYLTGDAAHFSYGRAERDGQRIRAIEYGVADTASKSAVSVTFLIDADSVSSFRIDGLNMETGDEAIAALWEDLTALKAENGYQRVPVSLNGTDLTPFGEDDLFFVSLSYLTAEPIHFEGEVEDVVIDNEDGTWLRMIDGEGYEAVFTCDAEGNDAVLVSFTILSDDLEGPRGVRIGDYFQEDFARFRSGEGEYDEATGREILYGVPGEAPSGEAEYGPGDQMVLRYITDTLSGRVVELYLHYSGTVLDEIVIHTL